MMHIHLTFTSALPRIVIQIVDANLIATRKNVIKSTGANLFISRLETELNFRDQDLQENVCLQNGQYH